MKKTIRIVAINIAVVLALLISVNIILSVVYDAWIYYNHSKSDPKVQLPNYDSHKWAEQLYLEERMLSSKYQSYVGWRLMPFNGETMVVDSLGIRVTVQSENVNETSKNAVFLGGSTMWGTGSNQENAIPALFSRISNGEYKSHNFGEGAYRAFQGYIFLNNRINDGLSPDLIVTMDGVNEIPGFLEYHTHNSNEQEMYLHSIIHNPNRKYYTRQMLIGPITEISPKILSRLSKVFKPQSYNYNLSEERTEKVARELLDSWLSIKRLADLNEAQFLAILQPNVTTGSPKLDHIENSLNPDFLRPYNVLYPKILEMIETQKYKELIPHFLDLTNIFDIDEYVYIDFCHICPRGNEIIAKKIFAYLQTIDSQHIESEEI